MKRMYSSGSQKKNRRK